MRYRQNFGPTAFMLAALLSVSVVAPIALPPRRKTATPDEYADLNSDPLPREGPELDPTVFIPTQSGGLFRYKEEQPERMPRCNNRWRIGKKGNKESRNMPWTA